MRSAPARAGIRVLLDEAASPELVVVGPDRLVDGADDARPPLSLEPLERAGVEAGLEQPLLEPLRGRLRSLRPL